MRTDGSLHPLRPTGQSHPPSSSRRYSRGPFQSLLLLRSDHIACSPDPSLNHQISPFYNFPEDTQRLRSKSPYQSNADHLACRGDTPTVGLGGRHADWVLLESLLRRWLCVVNGKGEDSGFGARQAWMGEAMIVGRVAPESSLSFSYHVRGCFCGIRTLIPRKKESC